MGRLSGVRALITRPQPQCDELVGLVKELGGAAYALPLVGIEPVPLKNIDVPAVSTYAFVIFVSRPAAMFGSALVKGAQVKGAKVCCYAIGPGTAETLKQEGVLACFSQEANSESLVDMRVLKQISGQKVLIIKGEGGRTYLKDTLQKRGAIVDTLDLYQRENLTYSFNTINNLVIEHRINVVVITSGQILANLLSQVDRSLIDRLNVIIPGQRLMKIAKKSGLVRLICATGANNNAILNSLYQTKND